jgi:hypothetical protein
LPAQLLRRKEIVMSKLIQTCTGLLLASTLFGASAQTSADHAQHHPAGAATAQATSTPAPGAMPAGGGMMDMMPGMEQHVKAMQDMRAKMLAAKTPAERQALMAEQMKLMQQGMGMMQGMQDMGAGMGSGTGADMGARMQMMEKRMDMMQSMMQGMMDRLAPPAAP